MYDDPEGNAIATIVVLSLICIGSLTGFCAAAYVDYKDDKKVFNGSIGWKTYVGCTLLGGIVGGVIGYFTAPWILHYLFRLKQ